MRQRDLDRLIKRGASGHEILMATVSESLWQQQIMEWAAAGGWCGFHIGRSDRALVTGVHTRRHGGHEDAVGWPDLVLVRGEELILPELKQETGSLGPGQERWTGMLNQVKTVESGIWRPGMADQVRRRLTGL